MGNKRVKKTVYLLSAYGGDYEDAWQRPIRVYATKALAEADKDTLRGWVTEWARKWGPMDWDQWYEMYRGETPTAKLPEHRLFPGFSLDSQHIDVGFSVTPLPFAAEAPHE
jgi:hypothetical protein